METLPTDEELMQYFFYFKAVDEDQTEYRNQYMNDVVLLIHGNTAYVKVDDRMIASGPPHAILPAFCRHMYHRVTTAAESN